MAVTVEELQILLSCDTSQAEKALQDITTIADKAVKKLDGKTGSSGGKGGKKGQLSYYEKLEQQLQSLTEQASQAFSQIGTEAGRVNFGHIMSEIDKVNKKLKSAGKQGEAAYEKMTGESLSSEERKPPVEIPQEGSVYEPYEPPKDSYYDPAEMARLRVETMREIAKIEQGDSSFKIDSDKLVNGTPFEKLQQQFNIAAMKVDELKRKLESLQGANAGSDKIAKIASQLDSAVSKAEKLAEKMAQIDNAGAEESSGGVETTAANIERTGAEAEKATPKIKRFFNALKGASKHGGIFGKMFGGFGKHFKKSEGFLSKFGATLKRVIMRMMAMGLVRGVINGISQGLQLLANASTPAASQFGKFTTMLNSVKASLGSAALAVLNAISGVLYSIASAAITAANAVANFFATLSGGSYFGIQMAESFDQVGESAKGAGGAAKGMLAAFDELNVIGNKGGGGGGGGASGLGNTTVEELTGNSKLAMALLNGEFEKAGQIINSNLNDISLKIGSFFDDLDSKDYGTKFGRIVNGIFSDPSAFYNAGYAVASGMNTVIHFLHNAITTIDWKQMGASFASGLNGIFRNVDFATAGKTLGTGITSIVSFLASFIRNLDFRAIARGFSDFLSNAIKSIDFRSINKDLTDIALELLNGLMEFLNNFDYATFISELFNSLRETTLGIIESIVSNPVRLLRILLNLALNLFITITGVVVGLIATAIDTLLAPVYELYPEMDHLGEQIAQSWDEKAGQMQQDADTMLDNLEAGWNSLTGQVEDGGNAVDDFGKKLKNLPTSGQFNYKVNISTSTTGTSFGNSLGAAISAAAEQINVAISHGGRSGKFANGGIVYGNTLANVGEYPGARVNPEVIAPLSDLNKILDNSSSSKANTQQMNEQNTLLRQQNELLAQILRKETVIKPSSALGQVVTRSQELYARA